MRITHSFLALAASVSAATISIDVGQNGALKFSPDSVTAAMGDTLEFHFYSGSGGHSVVSSTFSTPCQPATDAFFSGYIQGNEIGDMTFVTTVNSTDPIWFYCSLNGHCQGGMVGVVNPPSGQTAADYAAAAQNAQVSAPATIQGGVLTTVNPSAAMSSSSSISTTNTKGRETSTPSGSATSSSLTGMATDTGLRSSTSMSSGATGSASSVTGIGTNTNTREPTSTSASATAATTKSSAGMGIKEKSDIGAVMGLAVFAGGLVALMA